MGSAGRAARVFVVAQARMGSSRLPGKVLREAGGRSLLAHLARRLRRAQTPDALLIATTAEPSDDALAEAVEALGLQLHRGSTEDVLGRYLGALEQLGAGDEDLLVRVAGDCPLLDPQEIDRLVREFLDRRGGPEELDYLSNQARSAARGQAAPARTLPWGLDVELASVAALRRAGRETQAPGDREHVMPYLYREPGRFRVGASPPPGAEARLGQLRLTVDTPADLELVDAIATTLGPDAELETIAAWLAARPDIAALNAEVRQKSIAGEAELRAARVAGRTLLARADAHPQMGYGHVTRVGALLDAWIECGGRATLVGREIVGSARARLEGHGVRIVDGGDAAFEALLDQADALAVDGYAFDEPLQTRWRERAPLLSIDDIAAGTQVADLLVNQNLDFPRERYTCAPHTRLLLDHPYVLLRREFRGPGEAPLERRVVLSFGGSDPAGLSAPLAEALLRSLDRTIRVQLVVGPGVGEAARARLEALAAEHHELELLRDVEHMAALLRGALACVCAAGTTVWEAMACGTVVVAVAVADNQRPVIAGIERHRAGCSLGWHAELDPDHAARMIGALLSDELERGRLVARGRALVDGRGVYRVIDALLERMPDPLTP